MSLSWGLLVSAAKGAYAKVKSVVKSVVNTVSSCIKSVTKSIQKIGTAAVSKLSSAINGTKVCLKSVKNAAGNKLNNIRKALIGATGTINYTAELQKKGLKQTQGKTDLSNVPVFNKASQYITGQTVKVKGYDGKWYKGKAEPDGLIGTGGARQYKFVPNNVEEYNKGINKKDFNVIAKNNKVDYTESIIISGNYAKGDVLYKYRNFIEPSIKRINELKMNGNKNITWIIADYGSENSDKQVLQKYATNNNINLIFLKDKYELGKYINCAEINKNLLVESRNKDKISDMTIFGHGTSRYEDGNYRLALGYEEKNDKLNISIDDLKKMNIYKDSFVNNSTTWFASCNTGTQDINHKNSFAQEWANETNSKTVAVANGRTTYAGINNRDNKEDMDEWKREDSYNRNINQQDFSLDGCENYPVKSDEKGSENSEWKIYKKNIIPKNINEDDVEREVNK